MKIYKTVIFAVMLAVLLAAGCGAPGPDFDSLEQSEYDATDQAPGVSMTAAVAEGTVSLRLTNASGAEYVFGKEPRLEAEKDGVWYVVPPRDDVAWDDMGYMLPANGEAEIGLELDWYPALEAGRYRAVKLLYADGEPAFVIAEFEL